MNALNAAQPARYELVWRVFKNTLIHEVLFRFNTDEILWENPNQLRFIGKQFARKDHALGWEGPCIEGNSTHHFDPHKNHFGSFGFPLPEQGGIPVDWNGRSWIRIFMDDLFLCPDCGAFHPCPQGPNVPWLDYGRVDPVAMYEAIEQRRHAKEFGIRPCEWREDCIRIVNGFRERIDREAKEERQRLADAARLEELRRQAQVAATSSVAVQPKPDQCVYLIGGSGFVKIGVTMNVKKRLGGHQTSNPFPLKLFKTWTCRDARTTEALLHAKYAEFQQSGEWFRLSDDDLRILIAVDDLDSFLDGTSSFST